MSTLWFVRHGRATAGWDVDPDPPLDELGEQQAAELAQRLDGELPSVRLLSSPFRRCRETAAALAALRGLDLTLEPAVAEIPSPEGVAMADRVAWLRAAMAGEWSALGQRYTDFRDGVVAAARNIAADGDVVIFSHFVAINAVIGACLDDDRVVIRSLDNCSVTQIDVANDGTMTLVAGGHEADTLIR